MPHVPQPRVKLGEIEVDWEQLRLRRDGEWIRITPKAASVLHWLLDGRDRTVSRRELFDAVWPGSFSTDDALTQVVTELRRALDDPHRHARLIATVPKRGYRWIGPEPVEIGSDSRSTPMDASASDAARASPKHAGTVSFAEWLRDALARWRWWSLLAATTSLALLAAPMLHREPPRVERQRDVDAAAAKSSIPHPREDAASARDGNQAPPRSGGGARREASSR